MSAETRELYAEIHEWQIAEGTSARLPNYLDLLKLDLSGLICLDVGAGSAARDGIRLLEAGAGHVTLVDVGVDWMLTAQSELAKGEFSDVRYRLLDVESWMGADGESQFDFIACRGVLHHIEDPGESMRTIVRDLVPGGHFYVELMGKGGYVRDFVMHGLRSLYRSDEHFYHFMNSQPKDMVDFLVSGLGRLVDDRDRTLPQREARLLEALAGGIDVELMLTLKDRVMSPVYTEYDVQMAEELLAAHGLHIVQRVFPTPQFENIRSILEPIYAHPDRPLSRILMGSGNPHLLAQKPHAP